MTTLKVNKVDITALEIAAIKADLGLDKVSNLPQTAYATADHRHPPGQVLAPVVLTGNTALTELLHGNRPLELASDVAVTLTLPATATPGSTFFGINQGAGALSIVLDGGGKVIGHSMLPATIDQYSAFEVRFTTAGFRRVA